MGLQKGSSDQAPHPFQQERVDSQRFPVEWSGPQLLAHYLSTEVGIVTSALQAFLSLLNPDKQTAAESVRVVPIEVHHVTVATIINDLERITTRLRELAEKHGDLIDADQLNIAVRRELEDYIDELVVANISPNNTAINEHLDQYIDGYGITAIRAFFSHELKKHKRSVQHLSVNAVLGVSKEDVLEKILAVLSGKPKVSSQEQSMASQSAES